MGKKKRLTRCHSGGGWLYEDAHYNNYNRLRGYLSTAAQVGHMVAAGLAKGAQMQGSASGEGGQGMDFSQLGSMFSQNGQAAPTSGAQGGMDFSNFSTTDIDKWKNAYYGGMYACGGPINKFEGGGGLSMASAITEGASDALDTYVEASAVDDEAINASKQPLKNMLNNKVTSNSMDSLMTDWSNAFRAKTDWDRHDFQGASTFSKLAKGQLNASIAFTEAAESSGNPWVAAGVGTANTIGAIWGTASAKRKARREARKANTLGSALNDIQQQNFMSRSSLLDTQQDRMNAMGYAAYGGPLYTPDSAIGYQLANDQLLAQMQADQMKQKMGALPNYADQNIAAEGGEIHIKKSHRGLFTKKANAAGMGVQEYASHVLANKEDYPSSTVRQANFARNAAKWNANGGFLNVNGGLFDNNLVYVNEGGTHEENPNQGVPYGVDEQGVPNLVEEGELIWNDYVFSNRLKVPKDVRKRYKLGGDLTFAKAAERLGRESEERPNDPVSDSTLGDILADLAMTQEQIRAEKGETNYAACGGKVHRYDTGGLSRYNIDEYLQAIQNANYKEARHPESFINYTPNSRAAAQQIEADQTYQEFWNDLVKPENWNSEQGKQIRQALAAKTGRDWTKITPEQAKTYATTGNVGYYHTPVTLSMNTPAPVDTRAASTVPQNTPPAVDESLQARASNLAAESPNKAPARTGLEGIGEGEVEGNPNGKNYMDWLQYAPTVGSGLAVVSDALGITNRPHYGDADSIVQNLGNLKWVGTGPVGQYQQYSPMDNLYLMNQLQTQANAQRRGIYNAANNPAQAQALAFANNANTLSAMGELGIKLDRENLDRRNAVIAFNNALDQYNATKALDADKANMANNSLMMNAVAQAARMRTDERLAAEAARAANLSTFWNNLGAIGKNQQESDWIKQLQNSGFTVSKNKCGGMLTKKRKKR